MYGYTVDRVGVRLTWSRFRFGQANLEDTRKRTEAADDQARLKFNERFFDEKRQQYSDQLKHLDVCSTSVLPSV